MLKSTKLPHQTSEAREIVKFLVILGCPFFPFQPFLGLPSQDEIDDDCYQEHDREHCWTCQGDTSGCGQNRIRRRKRLGMSEEACEVRLSVKKSIEIDNRGFIWEQNPSSSISSYGEPNSLSLISLMTLFSE